jgi:hypothetical protein
MLVLRSKSGNISLARSSGTDPIVFNDSNPPLRHAPRRRTAFHMRARTQLKLLNPVIFSVIAESRLCANGHYVRVSFRGRRGRGRRSIWRNVDGSSVRRSRKSAGFRGESRARCHHHSACHESRGFRQPRRRTGGLYCAAREAATRARPRLNREQRRLWARRYSTPLRSGHSRRCTLFRIRCAMFNNAGSVNVRSNVSLLA